VLVLVGAISYGVYWGQASVLDGQMRTFTVAATDSELALQRLPAGVYVLTVQAPSQLPLTQRLVLE
jgi:hypothetical protein